MRLFIPLYSALRCCCENKTDACRWRGYRASRLCSSTLVFPRFLWRTFERNNSYLFQFYFTQTILILFQTFPMILIYILLHFLRYSILVNRRVRKLVSVSYFLSNKNCTEIFSLVKFSVNGVILL